MSWTSVDKKRIIKEQLRAKYGYKCAKCPATNWLTIDHIKPRSKGGAVEDINNMQWLCHECHVWKSYLDTF